MHSLKSNRGSVLFVALMFAAIIAISLTSYLKLSLNATTLANRSFYLNAAHNLMDIGIERTLWSLNNEYLYPSPANWTTEGGFVARAGFANEYQGTFPDSSSYYPLSGGAKGQVKVWAGGYIPATKIWHVVVKGIVTLGDGTTLSKVAETYLQMRSYSDRGMISRSGISFNGNVRVDSWISRPTPTDDIPYSAGIARTEAQIASPSLITVQNADVYGYVAIGTPTISVTGLDVGPSGRVRGAFSGPGSGPGVDTTRVTCDFTASFPDVNPASAGTWMAGITTSANLATGTYTVPSITYSGAGDVLSIGGVSPAPAANVILTVTNDVDLGGVGKILVYPGSTLLMYVGGNVTITGTAGVQNGTATVPNNADCFTLLGLRTAAQIAGGSTPQTWQVQGTSYLSCVIFGPNANIEVNGTGDTYGSIVGNDVDMVGSGNFHQDESLASKRISGLWKPLKWRELSTASDRATYTTELNF